LKSIYLPAGIRTMRHPPARFAAYMGFLVVLLTLGYVGRIIKIDIPK